MRKQNIYLKENVEVIDTDDEIYFIIEGFNKNESELYAVNVKIYINKLIWKSTDMVSISPFWALNSAQQWIGNNLRYYQKNNIGKAGTISLDEYIPLPKRQRLSWDED